MLTYGNVFGVCGEVAKHPIAPTDVALMQSVSQDYLRNLVNISVSITVVGDLQPFAISYSLPCLNVVSRKDELVKSYSFLLCPI